MANLPEAQAGGQSEITVSTAAGQVNGKLRALGPLFDCLQADAVMRRNLLRYDLKPTHRRLIEWLLLETFASGKDSVFVHGAERKMAKLIDVNEKELGWVLRELVRFGFVAREDTPDGFRLSPDPDASHWQLPARVSAAQAASDRASLLRDPKQEEMFPQYCEEPIKAVTARIGKERVIRDSSTPWSEIPTIQPTAETAGNIPQSEIPTTHQLSDAPAADAWRAKFDALKQELGMEPARDSGTKPPIASPTSAGPLAADVQRVMSDLTVKSGRNFRPSEQLAASSEVQDQKPAATSQEKPLPQEFAKTPEGALAWLLSLSDELRRPGSGRFKTDWARLCSEDCGYVLHTLRPALAKRRQTERVRSPLAWLARIAKDDGKL